jgi:hypothetical protein
MKMANKLIPALDKEKKVRCVWCMGKFHKKGLATHRARCKENPDRSPVPNGYKKTFNEMLVEHFEWNVLATDELNGVMIVEVPLGGGSKE